VDVEISRGGSDSHMHRIGGRAHPSHNVRGVRDVARSFSRRSLFATLDAILVFTCDE